MNRKEINNDIQKNGKTIFEHLKTLVINDSTKPFNGNISDHEKNKLLLKSQVKKIVQESNLDLNISDEKLWQLLWERIRYAGIKAVIATNEIQEYKKHNVFNDFNTFSLPEWNFDIEEWKSYKAINDKKNFEFQKIGYQAKNLLEKTGNFSGLKIVSNPYKLEKTIRFARDFTKFRNEKPNKPALTFFTGDNFDIKSLTESNFWQIQKKFQEYLGFITSFHAMMDLGFPTVKPDKVLTYVLAKLGWLTVFNSSVSREEVNKKYQKEEVAKDVISTALELSQTLENYDNPIREIDIWFVKFAQEPEPSFGITVNLEKTNDLQQIAENIRQNNL